MRCTYVFTRFVIVSALLASTEGGFMAIRHQLRELRGVNDAIYADRFGKPGGPLYDWR